MEFNAAVQELKENSDAPSFYINEYDCEILSINSRAVFDSIKATFHPIISQCLKEAIDAAEQNLHKLHQSLDFFTLQSIEITGCSTGLQFFESILNDIIHSDSHFYHLPTFSKQLDSAESVAYGCAYYTALNPAISIDRTVEPDPIKVPQETQIASQSSSSRLLEEENDKLTLLQRQLEDEKRRREEAERGREIEKKRAEEEKLNREEAQRETEEEKRELDSLRRQVEQLTSERDKLKFENDRLRRELDSHKPTQLVEYKHNDPREQHIKVSVIGCSYNFELPIDLDYNPEKKLFTIPVSKLPFPQSYQFKFLVQPYKHMINTTKENSYPLYRRCQQSDGTPANSTKLCTKAEYDTPRTPYKKDNYFYRIRYPTSPEIESVYVCGDWDRFLHDTHKLTPLADMKGQLGILVSDIPGIKATAHTFYFQVYAHPREMLSTEYPIHPDDHTFSSFKPAGGTHSSSFSSSSFPSSSSTSTSTNSSSSSPSPPPLRCTLSLQSRKSQRVSTATPTVYPPQPRTQRLSPIKFNITGDRSKAFSVEEEEDGTRLTHTASDYHTITICAPRFTDVCIQLICTHNLFQPLSLSYYLISYFAPHSLQSYSLFVIFLFMYSVCLLPSVPPQNNRPATFYCSEYSFLHTHHFINLPIIRNSVFWSSQHKRASFRQSFRQLFLYVRFPSTSLFTFIFLPFFPTPCSISSCLFYERFNIRSSSVSALTLPTFHSWRVI